MSLWTLSLWLKIIKTRTIFLQVILWFNKFMPFLQFSKLELLGQQLKWSDSVDKWWEDMDILHTAKWQLFTVTMMWIILGKDKIMCFCNKQANMSCKTFKKEWMVNQLNLLSLNFFKMYKCYDLASLRTWIWSHTWKPERFW